MRYTSSERHHRCKLHEYSMSWCENFMYIPRIPQELIVVRGMVCILLQRRFEMHNTLHVPTFRMIPGRQASGILKYHMLNLRSRMSVQIDMMFSLGMVKRVSKGAPASAAPLCMHPGRGAHTTAQEMVTQATQQLAANADTERIAAVRSSVNAIATIAV
eukprot:jgi/Ulvmu1/7593/UM038_0016.1